MRAMIGLKAIEGDMTGWMAACPGWKEFADVATRETPRARGLAIHEACKLNALLTAEEAAGAQGSLPLAAMAFAWMKKNGIDADVARTYARGIAGI